MSKTFKPPKEVAEMAKVGLELRHYYGRGGTRVGIARAYQLMKRENVSLATIKRMKAFFSRHRKNRLTYTKSGEPGNGTIAWLLWGGDAGKKWSTEVIKNEL